MGTILLLVLFLIAVIVVVKITINILAFVAGFVEVFGKTFWNPFIFYAVCALSAFFSYKIGLHDKFNATTFDKVACVIFVIFAPLFLKKK